MPFHWKFDISLAAAFSEHIAPVHVSLTAHLTTLQRDHGTVISIVGQDVCEVVLQPKLGDPALCRQSLLHRQIEYKTCKHVMDVHDVTHRFLRGIVKVRV